MEGTCPICGSTLKNVIGSHPDIGTYNGIECPNGCNLWDYYL